MTQDVIVTLIAIGIVALFAVRWWRRRGRQRTGVRVVRVEYQSEPEEARNAAIKPVAFFGGSGEAAMQAYISGALLNAADLDQSRALYERFAEACRAAGWDAYVPHQHADPVRDAGMSNVDVAQRDLDQVRTADALVAYVGEPSLGVGAEVAIALAAGKRVLLLAEREPARLALSAGPRRAAPGARAKFAATIRRGEATGWITGRLASAQRRHDRVDQFFGHFAARPRPARARPATIVRRYCSRNTVQLPHASRWPANSVATCCGSSPAK